MASVSKRKWTYQGVEKEAWIVRYKDAGGRHRQKTFDFKKDADRWRRQIEQELEFGTHIPAADHRTFGAACDEYLTDLRERVAAGEIRRTTLRERIYRLERHALPEFRTMTLQAMTEDRLTSWYRKLVASGLRPSTGSNYLALVGFVMEFAVKRKWIAVNAAKAVLRAQPRRKERVLSFTPDEARTLLREVEKRGYKVRVRNHATLRCFVNLAAYCGMRWGEIAALKVEHFDRATGLIRVRHSLDQLKQLQPPKTESGKRDLFAPRHVADMVAEYIDAYPSNDPEGLIFQVTGGLPRSLKGSRRTGPTTKAERLAIRSSNIANAHRIDNTTFHQHWWKPLLLRSGMAPEVHPGPNGKPRKTWRHFHALRHFAASFMLDSGWSVPDVSQRLGHSDPAITLRVYSHVLKSKDEQAAASQALAHRLIAQGAPADSALCNA